MAFGDPSKSERGHLQRDAFAPCGKSLNEGHGFSRAAEYAIGEGYLAAASINPCVRTRKEAADLTIPSLVGAPCFSRGELDLSPAETGFISQEWALALAGAKAYDQPRTLSRDAEALLSKLAGEMGVGLFNLLKRFESSQSEQKRVAKSSSAPLSATTLQAEGKKPQVPPLRCPGFPVESGGVGGVHAAFSTESRIRGC